MSPSTPAAWLPDERISLAPMMEKTDRHFRFLLRLLSRRMVLYTEMVVSTALHYNEEMRDRSLRFNAPDEHPVVLQLGGADAAMLKEASRLALPYGYDAVNLNCGCPSERVSGSGCFGAALMREPQLVAELCMAMGEGVGGQVPITVKCRIGVDDDDSYAQLAEFVRVVSEQSPVRHFVVHARKAILGGLSPEQNRKVPPLKYPYVYRLVKVSLWNAACGGGWLRLIYPATQGKPSSSRLEELAPLNQTKRNTIGIPPPALHPQRRRALLRGHPGAPGRGGPRRDARTGHHGAAFLLERRRRQGLWPPEPRADAPGGAGAVRGLRGARGGGGGYVP